MDDVWLTQQVAAALNASRGADYEAVRCVEQDSVADTVLISRDHRLPSRLVQVTTIPRDMRHREATNNRARLERDLRNSVASREMGCVITVHLTEEGHRFGLKPRHISQVSDLIADTAAQPFAEWNDEDLYAVDVKLSEYVSGLHVARLPGYGEVNVIVPFSGRPRADGTWIQEAIEAKTKYGRQTVANVILIIGALGLITPRQIASFQESTSVSRAALRGNLARKPVRWDLLLKAGTTLIV